MLPHSYTIDSQSKSQDLSAEILAASSPLQISAACNSLHTFLRHISPDQSRWFFSIAFPTLIAKLFGFDDSSKQAPSAGWIDAISSANDADLAGKVFGLLSPDGALMSLISAVDRLSLVKYVFPTERLPEWVRYLLSSEQSSRVVTEICPLFRDRVKEEMIKGSEFQVRLNVFEYYMFWFAYYPVCRGKSENSRCVSVQRVSKFRLENWTSSFPGFSSSSSRRGAESKAECNLYMWLLYAYLRKFVPAYDLNVHQPYRSSIRHYPSNYDGSVMMQAEFVVSTFVHFWLVDNDFSPLPVSVCKSFGFSFSLHSVLGETPPVSGLGELVKLFVKYVNMSFVAAAEGPDVVESTESLRFKALSTASFDASNLRDVWLVPAGVLSPTSFNVMIQRAVYRFILRTFLFCPVDTSIKNASEVFSVWITYIEPWKIISESFAEFDALMDGSLKNKKVEDRQQLTSFGYSAGWRDYVLSNYLFYSSLVMHFIGFAHKFLHANPEAVVQMMLKVMNVLTGTKELTDLIREMDAVFHSKAIGSGKSMLSSLYKYVPSICEQLQDWEDGLCESDADGSFLHENWNRDLRLFSDGEDGGQQLLQLFILRAEYELQATSGDSQSTGLKCIDSLKSQISYIFGNQVMSPKSVKENVHENINDRHELFKPRKVGKSTLGDVRYKGDWMRRPASGDEVAWLADLLVRLSAWLNENLGLNRPMQTEIRSVNISHVSKNNIYGTKDTVKMVVSSVGSWLMILGLGMVDLMRKRGFRINLRLLASKKVLVVLFIVSALSVLRKCLSQA
uniref:Sphingomyelin phosphodiesterase 4 n=1 Tax=Kalanchoe fedtschenkoi TaxID=63787 RepID=A0A7N0VG90_KALFE